MKWQIGRFWKVNKYIEDLEKWVTIPFLFDFVKLDYLTMTVSPSPFMMTRGFNQQKFN